MFTKISARLLNFFPSADFNWLISNNLTTEKEVPDFVNYIYFDCLLAVKPEAVNVIR